MNEWMNIRLWGGFDRLAQEKKDIQEIGNFSGVQLNITPVIFSYQHHRVAFTTSTGRTTGSMDKELGRGGAVVVNDGIYDGDI